MTARSRIDLSSSARAAYLAYGNELNRFAVDVFDRSLASPWHGARLLATLDHTIRARAALMTAYAAGLRVSKVAALRLDHIDSQCRLIRVQQGKGKKDRYAKTLSRVSGSGMALA